MTLDSLADNIVINRIDSSTFAAEVKLFADLSVFDGHFPGNPILPGVAYIGIAERLAERFLGGSLELKQLKRTKFFAPSFPENKLNISGNVTCDAENEKIVNVQVTFSNEQMQRICLVKMIMEMLK